MGNDLSGNVGSPSAAAATAVVGTTAHDQDHSSSGLYQMTSPMGKFVMYYFVVHQYEKKSMLSLSLSDQEASTSSRQRPKASRVVDAAEKVRTSYFNRGLAKVRMLLG